MSEPISERTFDRRLATSQDIARLVEQNQQISNTMQIVVSTMNNHETRLAVLEVKTTMGEEKTKEIKEAAAQTLAILSAHTEQENKDRQRLLLATVLMLLSVVGSGVLQLIQWAVK